MKVAIKNTFLLFALMASLVVYGQDTRIEISGRGNSNYRHKTTNGFTSTEIEYRGKIVFNENDTDVESISSGGFLKISQKTFGTRRTAVLEGKSNGVIERNFYIGNKLQNWEPEGADWFADVLLDVIRSSGLGADTRVSRFYGKGGTNAVIDEIDEIDSDYVKGIYYAAAVNIKGISSTDINKLISSASQEISSDYELSRFYIKNSDLFLESNSSVTAVLEGTKGISSDFEQARVLMHYIKEDDLNDAQINAIIKASGNISSDFENSRVLLTLVDKGELSNESLQAMMNSIDNISSDYEKSRVLQATIKKQELTNRTISMIIKASNEISSDFEQARVLSTLSGMELDDDNLRAVAMATKNISSDYEKSRVLSAIMDKNEINAENLAIIIEATSNISSDFEHARVLTNVINQDELSDATFIAITKATEDISSSYETKRVLKALINKSELGISTSLALLDAIENIRSSFDKSSLMIAMGPKLPDDSEVFSRFREVAKTISSDHDYGKVMRSVDF